MLRPHITSEPGEWTQEEVDLAMKNGGNCNLTTKICDLDVIYIYISIPPKPLGPACF
jgi:hypothetical protein